MPGVTPKPAAMRRRMNKTSTAAKLRPEAHGIKGVPRLPDTGVDWHPLTREFWRELWRSPVRDELLRVDLHGLYVLADLTNQYWNKPSIQLAAEIRQQRMCYGLTPIDRRRLQWDMKPKADEPVPDGIIEIDKFFAEG